MVVVLPLQAPGLLHVCRITLYSLSFGSNSSDARNWSPAHVQTDLLGASFKRCLTGSRKVLLIPRAAHFKGSEQDAREGDGPQESEWLRQQLSSDLEREGLDCATSRRIADACAEACQKFLRSGHGAFDPVVIMDAMEEEVERRDLRGDFLPFEISRKAAKILAQRWVGPATRPPLYTEAQDNKLDVVDLSRFPKPPSA